MVGKSELQNNSWPSLLQRSRSQIGHSLLRRSGASPPLLSRSGSYNRKVRESKHHIAIVRCSRLKPQHNQPTQQSLNGPLWFIRNPIHTNYICNLTKLDFSDSMEPSKCEYEVSLTWISWKSQNLNIKPKNANSSVRSL